MAQHIDTLIAGLVADLRPVRPLEQRRGIGFALAAMLVSVAANIVFVGFRRDIVAGQIDPVFLLSSGLFLLLALASSLTVIDMGKPQVGAYRDGWIWALATAALLPASALLMTVIALMKGEQTHVDSDGVWCFVASLALGLTTATALVAWLRKGAATSPQLAGLLTGLAAGSSGIFAFSLYCPHNDIAHIGLWHGMAVVVSAGLGRLLVPGLIRW